MRLTLHTDYALRMLMQLAVAGDRLVTVAEVADRHEISKNHLMKVAQTLSNLGMVHSVRGRGGGLQLGRPAKSIPLGAVARALEQGSALVACFPNGNGACRIVPSCRLKGILAEAQEAFFSVLDRYSVDDLVKRNPDLHLILEGDAA